MTATAPTWSETDHPRIGDGTFTDKLQTAPEVTLSGGLSVEEDFVRAWLALGGQEDVSREDIAKIVAELNRTQNFSDDNVDAAVASVLRPASEETVREVVAPAETVFSKRYDTVKEKVEAFHDELEQRVAGLADDENWKNFLDTMSKFHRYSMYNQLLIQLQRPGATRVAGFRKWKELDRSVVKGEKGISILRPAAVTADAKDKDGKVITGPDGKPTKTRKVIGFTTTTVFDVSQTEGKPLPTAYEELSEEPPAGFVDDLEQSIRDLGFTVSYEDLPGSEQGSTSPKTKRVVIDSKLNPAERANTLAHELGHIACGHMDRLDEYHTGHGGARGAMEVEAESFSYVVCRSQGMSPAVGGSSSTYVAGWSKNDPEAVKKSAELVSKSVKTVLSNEAFTAREEAREQEADDELLAA